jgi:DNA-binding Lrp family transcriptional regulator
VDSIDAGIIRELSGPSGSYPWDVRESYSKIAHKLGIDQKTIWRRIRNLERQKILEGSEVVVNPYYLGYEPVRMILTVQNHEHSKERVVSQLIHVDRSILILNWEGPIIHVLFFCENEESISRKIKLVSSICGSDNPIILRNSDALGFSACKIRPTKKDLLILRSMRKHPRKKAQQIATEVRISTRTVERRINELILHRAFFHMVRMGFQNVAGLTCSIFIFYSDQTKKSSSDIKFSSWLQRLVFSATTGTLVSQFTFICKNAAEAVELEHRAQTLEGVEKIIMGHVIRYILVTDWLDYEIERLIYMQ